MTATELHHVGLYPESDGRATRQQAGSDVFGFWVYLMSDAIIFALLFATYGIMLRGTAGGPGPSDVYDIRSAFIETLLLLTSSFTYGLATIATKQAAGRFFVVVCLGVTLLLGATFIGFEIHDLLKMMAQGAGPDRSGFLSAFFALVPLHGLHVTIGSLWIGVMIVQVLVFGLDTRVRINLLRLGLFWHFLDIVWIAIFSIVYLQGLAA